MKQKIQVAKETLQKRIDNCSHEQVVGSRCFCRTLVCPEKNCQAINLKMTSIASHYYKKHPNLTPELKAFPLQAFTCDNCRKDFKEANPYSLASSSKELASSETYCGSCERELTKIRQVSQNSKKNMSKIKKNLITIKKTKTLTKPRSIRSKTDTLAYYNCLIDQVADPLNAKVKITSLAHHCKCNKGKVAVARQEHKAQLVQAVAKNYKAFGESLGHYLHADIVGCVKEMKK